MKVSARNQFRATITAVKHGAVNSELELKTEGGEPMVAVVTNESVKTLGLEVGGSATALVKASSVLVMTDGDRLRLSARNCLVGTIIKVSEGPVGAEVSIELARGGLVQATITRDASAELGLKAGMTATAVFKASAVIIAVEA